MAHYIVSYDLHNQRVYKPVWDRLESLGATRLLESLWVLTSTLSATQLRDQVKAAADADDSVAVLELKAGMAWAVSGARQGGIDWLRSHFP